LAVVLFGKVKALPLQIGRGILTQVGDRIEDSAAQDLHQFRHAPIVMEAAEHVLGRKRDAILDEVVAHPERPVFRAGIRLFEKSALVAEDVGNEDFGFGEFGRRHLNGHARVLRQLEMREPALA
jgi:hypothetical protein